MEGGANGSIGFFVSLSQRRFGSNLHLFSVGTDVLGVVLISSSLKLKSHGRENGDTVPHRGVMKARSFCLISMGSRCSPYCARLSLSRSWDSFHRFW